MKYKGILAKPRPYRRPPGLIAGAMTSGWEEWRRAEAAATWEVLLELCKAHGLTPDASFPATELLFALLNAHVPGFRREKAPRGPKPKWDAFGEAELHADVNDWRLRRVNKTSILQACKAMASSETWKAMCGNGTPTKKATALSKHYYKANAQVLAMVRSDRARKFLELSFSAAQIECMSQEDLETHFQEANPGASLDSVT